MSTLNGNICWPVSVRLPSLYVASIGRLYMFICSKDTKVRKISVEIAMKWKKVDAKS